MKRVSSSLLPFLVLSALTACEQPRAHGDANAVIVAADEDFWYEVEEAFREQMEPTVQTVREEHPFRITHQDPREPGWGQLSRFRQVVAMGPPGTPWVEEALERAGADNVSPPAVLEARNVWARGQQVWIMLLPEQDPGGAVSQVAAEVQERLDSQFREWARSRMYVSGRDTILADSLARNVGFSLTLPKVYRYAAEDTVFRFRNDNPSPSELIREISVTWWEPGVEEVPSREELLDWRLQHTRQHYVSPQDLDTTVVTYRPLEVNGARGVELHSSWVSTPEAWPAGGPFLIRALQCPEQDRTYLIDAWVYAPNREKYEYVIQLQTILDTFRCG